MTNALPETIAAAVSSVTAIDDPVERYMAARDRRAEIATGDRAFMEIQRAVVWSLYEGRTWEKVGELLNISGSRAEAIARGR